MNCEEYVVEKLQKLEQENKDLKNMNKLNDEIINRFITQVKAFNDLLSKSKLELQFNAEYDTYALTFNGFYTTITDKGKENIKEIVNDLKILNIDSDIVKAFEEKK